MPSSPKPKHYLGVVTVLQDVLYCECTYVCRGLQVRPKSLDNDCNDIKHCCDGDDDYEYSCALPS